MPLLETPTSTGRLLIVTHHLPWVVSLLNFTPTSIPSIYSSLPRSVAKRLNIRNESTNEPCRSTNGSPTFEFTTRRGHSALFSGIRSLRSTHSQVLHIGWSGPVLLQDSSSMDATGLTDELREKMTLQLLEEKNCIPVFYNDKISGIS